MLQRASHEFDQPQPHQKLAERLQDTSARSASNASSAIGWPVAAERVHGEDEPLLGGQPSQGPESPSRALIAPV